MQTTFTSVIHPAPVRNVSSKVRLSAVTTNKVFLLKFQKIYTNYIQLPSGDFMDYRMKTRLCTVLVTVKIRNQGNARQTEYPLTQFIHPGFRIL